MSDTSLSTTPPETVAPRELDKPVEPRDFTPFVIRINEEVVWESSQDSVLYNSVEVNTPRGQATRVMMPNGENVLDLIVVPKSLESQPLDLLEESRRQRFRETFEKGHTDEEIADFEAEQKEAAEAGAEPASPETTTTVTNTSPGAAPSPNAPVGNETVPDAGDAFSEGLLHTSDEVHDDGVLTAGEDQEEVDQLVGDPSNMVGPDQDGVAMPADSVPQPGDQLAEEGDANRPPSDPEHREEDGW